MTHPTEITAQPGLPFVDIVREFDAPAEAVFRAHTEPRLFAQWTGPRDMHMDSVEIDPTPGGKWMYAFRPQGSDTALRFFGVYHAVEPNALIVQTFEFSMAPGHVGLSRIAFEDQGGRTRLTMREVYPSVETRDAAVASGMEYGITEGFERLDALVNP